MGGTSKHSHRASYCLNWIYCRPRMAKFIDQRQYRYARRFWGPLVGGELQIIVSRF